MCGRPALLRVVLAAGLSVLPAGCLTPKLWEAALAAEDQLVRTETAELVAFGRGDGEHLVVQVRDRGGAVREFQLVPDDPDGCPRLLALARSGRAQDGAIRLHSNQGSAELGEGSVVLQGPLEAPTRWLREDVSSAGGVVDLPAGLVVKPATLWSWTGDAGAPPDVLQPVGWLWDGQPVAATAVAAAFGDGTAAPQLATLRDYELCLVPRGPRADALAGIAVRADALWLDHCARVVGSGGRLHWSYDLRVTVGLASHATAPREPVALPERLLVSVTWHERRSRMLPILGAALVTPLALVADAAGALAGVLFTAADPDDGGG